MSENNLSEIVGEDVNLASEAPETPEAPQETQETPPEASQEQPETKEPDSRVVPLAALHEERQRRKELAAELARDREERARRDAVLEQRLAALTQSRQQEQVPSFDENPALHLQHQISQVQQTSQATAEQIANWQRQQQYIATVQNLSAAVQQHEVQFAQAAPDYMDAVTFLRNQRAAELVADGADEQAAVMKAAEELRNLALERAHRGQNAAEVAYKLAKARGYAPKAAAPAQPTGQQVIQNQQRVSAASKTLGGGGAPSGKLTLEALASMSDDEFAEATKGNKWAQIAGG